MTKNLDLIRKEFSQVQNPHLTAWCGQNIEPIFKDMIGYSCTARAFADGRFNGSCILFSDKWKEITLLV